MIPRLLLTGAAGKLGRHLRTSLRPYAQQMRLSDIAAMDAAAPGEEVQPCQLADKQAVDRLVDGCDAIVHMGGLPTDYPFEDILEANIKGVLHIYEGARKNGVKRVVYASSVHAIGYHALEDQIDANAPHRPDGLYGLSKCFVEDLGRLYWDKFGIETAALRIFSSFPEPADRRMLWSWLSFDDCVRLVTAALTAPRVGFTVSFGLSDNAVKPVDNRLAAHLGYRAQDNTEAFRAGVAARAPLPDPKAPAVRHLGGWFVDLGHPDDEAKK